MASKTDEAETEEVETEEVEGEEGEDNEGTGTSTLEKLEAKVDSLAEAVQKFISGKSGNRPSKDEAAQVGEQVKQEVAKLSASEKKNERDSALVRKVEALEAKLAGMEKTPVEYRKVTRFMWGDE